MLFFACGMQAQNITIIDTTESYNPHLTLIEFAVNCSPYFSMGTMDNYETIFVQGYSDTEEHFFILIDCNGYIIEVDGIKHKTELNKVIIE